MFFMSADTKERLLNEARAYLTREVQQAEGVAQRIVRAGEAYKAERVAIAEGHFAGDVEPEQFAWDFQAITLAYHYSSQLIRDPAAERRARNAFEQLVRGSRAGRSCA